MCMDQSRQSEAIQHGRAGRAACESPHALAVAVVSRDNWPQEFDIGRVAIKEGGDGAVPITELAAEVAISAVSDDQSSDFV